MVIIEGVRRGDHDVSVGRTLYFSFRLLSLLLGESVFCRHTISHTLDMLFRTKQRAHRFHARVKYGSVRGEQANFSRLVFR